MEERNAPVGSKGRVSREKLCRALASLPTLKTVEEGRQYAEAMSGGAIWAIFWLHCINAELFPIFDQHTFRAMHWIEKKQVQEIPLFNPTKLRVYFDRYVPFLEIFAGNEARTVDKALFAYGKTKKAIAISSP